MPERHFVDIDALHQVFELRIDGRSAIGVSRFGRGLIRSIRRRSGTVACSPGRAAFVTGRRLPDVSSWVRGGSVAMKSPSLGRIWTHQRPKSPLRSEFEGA